MRNRPYLIGWSLEEPGTIIIHTRRALILAGAVMLIGTGITLVAIGLAGAM